MEGSPKLMGDAVIQPQARCVESHACQCGRLVHLGSRFQVFSVPVAF